MPSVRWSRTAASIESGMRLIAARAGQLLGTCRALAGQGDRSNGTSALLIAAES